MAHPSSGSGAGTRPTTSGTIDNIGAGETFQPGTSDHGPAPTQRMADKRDDAQSVENDDSAAFGLTEDADDVRPDARHPKPA